ncbi:DISARM system phospholipase D-like protein DrmC [bacterium]|nr:DISARM system phospholipase D-like protein DrmC [Mariniblastus sp.]MDA7878974.1 DISARM system phospholipase D-like protein DrmC [bacterium]
MENSDAFAQACADLVGKVATNPTMVDAIIAALESEKLKPNSGPLGISNVLKGAPGRFHLSEFLNSWNSNAPNLNNQQVTATIKSAMACYKLAQSRAHIVDPVWTGPDVSGSELRRTEAVVNEILASAEKELLIVGYWLVTSTEHIRELLDLLIEKSRSGVRVRFIFDSGEKSSGPDNFSALDERWPADLPGAKREVYRWNSTLTQATSNSGFTYDRKLHAKVIVSDHSDALVTSANLTKAGFQENLEMGLRIQGDMAGAIVRHFDLLIDQDILNREF